MAPGTIEIETTRPELIPACVALVAHPDDDALPTAVRHGGADAAVRRAGARARACAGRSGKGQRRRHDLHVRRRDGRHVVARAVAARSRDPAGERRAASRHLGRGRVGIPRRSGSQQHYDQLAGLSAVKARTKIVELLKESGDLIGDPRPITHHVKFYEKGDRPLEIITSRQWFLQTMAHRPGLLARGEELHWFPAHMRARYENWVNGLNGDWCVSRQRFFGVPFPVWYRIGADGAVDHSARLIPAESQLPIDPSTDVPAGSAPDQRDVPGGFTGDPDIMDTWATSSLSPFIVCGWETDAALWAQTYPMHLRPQAHDIIRTWLFSTVLRSHLETGQLPWENAAISGWVLDPDRKKMSKSKGNVVTPMGLLEEHGSDAVRYWAAKGGPGVDTAFDAGQMQVGRRLAIKLLNASKFVLGKTEPAGPVTHPVDRGMLTRLADVVRTSTAQFRRLRLHGGLARDRNVLLVVLRRLHRAGEAPPRDGFRRRRIGDGRVFAGALGAAASVRAIPAVRHRGGVAVVARGIDSPGGLADRG